jgi:uncharacterized protein (UPF0128 family)
MITELREAQLLNTLVFETLGQPEREREFKIKSLKKWGFDLVFGKKDGVETFWGVEEGSKKAGDMYVEDEVNHEVTKFLKNFQKIKKCLQKLKWLKEERIYTFI